MHGQRKHKINILQFNLQETELLMPFICTTTVSYAPTSLVHRRPKFDTSHLRKDGSFTYVQVFSQSCEKRL